MMSNGLSANSHLKDRRKEKDDQSEIDFERCGEDAWNFQPGGPSKAKARRISIHCAESGLQQSAIAGQSGDVTGRSTQLNRRRDNNIP
jgi:hypothetical protein